MWLLRMIAAPPLKYSLSNMAGREFLWSRYGICRVCSSEPLITLLMKCVCAVRDLAFHIIGWLMPTWKYLPLSLDGYAENKNGPPKWRAVLLFPCNEFYIKHERCFHNHKVFAGIGKAW